MPSIFKKLEKIKPVYDWTYKIMLFICKLLLIGDIIITTWAVLGRYIPFITDPHWSEEIVLTFMAYMAVLSATLAIRRRAHIRMTTFDNKLPRKVIIGLDILADVAVMALGAGPVGLALLTATIAIGANVWKIHATATYVTWYYSFLLLGTLGPGALVLRAGSRSRNGHTETT